MNDIPFSKELEDWLKSSKQKTLDSLEDVFGEKGFALAFMLLMFIPALPIPTGGITHFFLQPVTMILALEMIAGQRTIWLPKKVKTRQIGSLLEGRALPFIVKRVRWLEKWSRPRLSSLLNNGPFRSFIGIIVFSFTLAAFVAPPFSGLDTLPSIGVVVIAIAMILEDILLFIVGLLVGAIGTGLVIGVGLAANEIIRFIF